ncbi:hypothetical protein BS47DRAFT_1358788 [Hydnum rufescens UP504]|uniref:Major facilitator superfamily (MFS) profile domain-containing protein n=1 Tax=Hydnum rufescens UP504 TaxID=1448309 RepID=A0A9P6B904_9AGAM|nr:hypothetical protein BS47DRAFT_1358788 [Hydnum rufescens UP504]
MNTKVENGKLKYLIQWPVKDFLPSSYASDRIGRKPVILGGTAGLAVSIVSFGMSRAFSSLVLSRCIGGALGGSFTAIRTMAGEITDRGITITYRLGQIIGLPLGGFLAHPERQFPNTFFDGPFWQKYPFVLPCFVGAAFALFAVVLGSFFLEETLPSKIQNRKKLATSRTTSVSTVVDGELSLPLRRDQDQYGIINGNHNQPSNSNSKLDHRSPPEEIPSLFSVLTNDIVALMISNFAMCLASEMLFTLYPLFAFTPIKSGGLGFNEAQIGAYLSVRGVMHIAIMFLFTPMHRWIGRSSALRLYQLSMMMWPLVTLFYPLMNFLAKREGASGSLFNGVMFAFFVVWSFAAFCWTCTGMMTNDACPSPAALAAVNGVIQMSTILSQATAPAFSTSLFAYSIKSDLAGGRLVWVVCFVITCAGSIHSLFLNEATSDWRMELGDHSETSSLSGSASTVIADSTTGVAN